MRRALFFFLTILLIGCVTPERVVDRAIGRTVDSAADRVGQRIGDAIAADILARNPHLLHAYTLSVFQMMFYAGGYYFEAAPYQPGQFSRWEAVGVEEGDWMERTLLMRRSDGSEWWRIETRTRDDGQEHVVIMETLLTSPADDGSQRVLRMRAKLPSDQEPREIPVREDDSRTWVMRAEQRLTQESLEGMKVGQESIETKAGIFSTDHIRTTHGVDGTVSWWVSDEVPGGLVRYARTPSGHESPDAVLELSAYGDGQTDSVLGVDLLDVTLEEPDENDTVDEAND